LPYRFAQASSKEGREAKEKGKKKGKERGQPGMAAGYTLDPVDFAGA